MTDSKPYWSYDPPTCMGNLMKMIPLFRELVAKTHPYGRHIPVPTICYVPPGFNLQFPPYILQNIHNMPPSLYIAIFLGEGQIYSLEEELFVQIVQDRTIPTA